MNKNERLKKLENTLEENAVRVIYDKLKSEGGLCKVRNKYYLIINRNLSIEQKITIMSESLLEVSSPTGYDNKLVKDQTITIRLSNGVN